MVSSAMGSVMSSPSTSTVYSAVIDPLWFMPTRSISFGSVANTDGG